MAASNRPFASAAFDGATTLMPGTAMAQFSRLCECCDPKRAPAPFRVRITSGDVIWPLLMYRALGISLAT